MIKTDYNNLALTYNRRYADNNLENVEVELINLITLNNYRTILEAGCGTGRWIGSIKYKNTKTFGLDYAYEMLKIAKTNNSYLNLVNADAISLPLKNNFFDLIFCVNAIHHFPDKLQFIREAKRTIKNNGMLAVFTVDPLIDKDWYVYDYFDSVYANDLKRFIPLNLLKNYLEAENFTDVDIKEIEKVYHQRTGSNVFNDPFLKKHSCSQLANLSDKEYQKGIKKIENQITKNPETVFTTSVVFYLVSAKKSEE